MTKLIEKKTKRKNYTGLQFEKLNGWTIYKKEEQEGPYLPFLFLTNELFNERFIPIPDEI